MSNETEIRPFRVDMPGEALTDLRQRIAATRWPSKELVADVGRIAGAWAELMRRLGYTRDVAQGGDVGAAVTDAMGRQALEGLLGIHMNLLLAGPAGAYRRRIPPRRNARRSTRSPRSARAATATSSSRTRGRRRSATPCWIPPSPWRPGCSTTTPTATTRSPAPSSTISPPGDLTPDRIVDNITLTGCGTGASPARSYWKKMQAAAQVPASLVRRSSSWSASSCSRRDLPGPAQLGREVVPQRHLTSTRRQGRPIRRLGRGRAVRDRDLGGVQVAALTAART